MKIKTILIFAIIAFLLVHLVGFIRFGELSFYWVYFEDALTESSSIDPLIARIISVFLGLIALFIAPYFFSIKYNKFLVFAFCYGLWIIINTTIILAYPDITECKQCMALNPNTNKYEFFNCPRKKPKFHKLYGTKVFCAEYPNQRVIPSDNTIFFTNNGEPLLWYYINENGQYEIFNQRGNHPKFGIALKEMSSETAKIIEYLRVNDPGMIIGTNLKTKAELNRIAIEAKLKDSLERKRELETGFSFSQNEKWSTTFILYEKSAEYIEKNTNLSFLCKKNSPNLQTAYITVYYPDGKMENLEDFEVGQQHLIDFNNYKLRLYIINVSNGGVEQNDFVSIKLENIIKSQ